MKPRLGDLVTPSYPLIPRQGRLGSDGVPWGTVVAERGIYVDVMWSNGKVEEFWSEQDLTVHVRKDESR